MSPPAFLGANLTASYNILIQELMVGGSECEEGVCSLMQRRPEDHETFSGRRVAASAATTGWIVFYEAFLHSMASFRRDAAQSLK